MARITNNHGISLPLAVWLATDDYDFHRGSRKAISATSLLKPTRQILLRERLTDEHRETPDVADFIASRSGHAFHDSIETSWAKNYRSALQKLGYPDTLINAIRINPETEEEGTIPVYLEQRAEREYRGYVISGKFDMVLEGQLNDTKSTSVWSWIKGSKDEDYALQGSLYRWLNRDKITSDTIAINFIFTDWQRSMVKTTENYPEHRVLTHHVPLLSIKETENWLDRKLDALEAAADLPEADLPRCEDKDLWRSETVYKYFADPAKTAGRSTKNFKTLLEASAHKAKAGKGVIITVPGQVKACSYCPAFPICTQKDEYDHG